MLEKSRSAVVSSRSGAADGLRDPVTGSFITLGFHPVRPLHFTRI
jgi:hypothetical protein